MLVINLFFDSMSINYEMVINCFVEWIVVRIINDFVIIIIIILVGIFRVIYKWYYYIK